MKISQEIQLNGGVERRGKKAHESGFITRGIPSRSSHLEHFFQPFRRYRAWFSLIVPTLLAHNPDFKFQGEHTSGIIMEIQCRRKVYSWEQRWIHSIISWVRRTWIRFRFPARVYRKQFPPVQLESQVIYTIAGLCLLASPLEWCTTSTALFWLRATRKYRRESVGRERLFLKLFDGLIAWKKLSVSSRDLRRGYAGKDACASEHQL